MWLMWLKAWLYEEKATFGATTAFTQRLKF